MTINAYNKDDLNSIFRINLKAAIKAHPKTKKDICLTAGYSPGYVGHVLSGTKPNPSLYFVACMAGALNIDPLELLTSKSRSVHTGKPSGDCAVQSA